MLIVALVAKSLGKLREYYLALEVIEVNLLKNNLLNLMVSTEASW